MSEDQTQSAQTWIPLESNPEVFNAWAKKAGLVGQDAVFQDVYGLDEELLGLVGQPVKAVILLFPDGKEVQDKRRAEDVRIKEDGQPNLDKTIFWIKQTINNACGTMALIHTLANTDVTLSPFGPLSKFIDQCRDKDPLQRAKLLETTPLFTKIHAELATESGPGRTHVPESLDTDLHFVCFVEAPDADFRDRAAAAGRLDADSDSGPVGAGEDDDNKEKTGMRLVELDGTCEGPVDRGECKDLLKDVAEHVKKEYLANSSSVNFSMIAFGPPPE